MTRLALSSYLFLIFPLLMHALPVSAQNNDFYPVKEDSNLLSRLFETYQRQYKEGLGKLPSRYKKDYLDLYALRWTNIREKFDKQEICTSHYARQYLDALVAEITGANPGLRDHPFTCYFSRSGIPNASYIGEGIILFNMGLFDRLDDENQAAFVICHEIAHLVLQHPEKSIDKYVTTINSEEIQQELRKIRGSEYRKHEQLQNLVKGLTFDSRRHSRDHESEADSMAVELMRTTRFDCKGALTALALLDVIDTDTLHTAACLQRIFDAKNYPFQKKWIAKEEGLLGGHARLVHEGLEDSLKTHPACQQRIKQLSPFVSAHLYARPLKFVIDSLAFKKLQLSFRYEVIEYAFEDKNYTRSLFYTLELLQPNPRDPWLISQVGRIFNGLHAAQQSHVLSRFVDLPAPDYPSNYNLLLQFVQNLYLDNMANINYQYLSQFHPQMDAFRPFKEAYEQSERIFRQ